MQTGAKFELIISMKLDSNKKSDLSVCLYCQDILKGRSDKKFCNEACRNAHNNDQKAKERTSIKRVDLSLKKNRRILSEMIGTNKTVVVDKLILLRSGFDTKYHTHQHLTGKQETYKYCYDLGWKEIEGGLKIMIVWDVSPDRLA
jgi:hypothetical protein